MRRSRSTPWHGTLAAWAAALAVALAAAHAGAVAPPAAEKAAPALELLPPQWSAYEEFEGPLCAVEEQLFADAALGRVNDAGLLRAALIAGGVGDPTELQWCADRVAQAVKTLHDDPRLSGPPRRQAQVVFEFMHAELLYGGYVRDCTDLATTLRTGRYNCVSATVLYDCLASGVGLNVCGLEIPGHAMSRLFLPEGGLDVETTCARWFRILDDPRKKTEATQRVLGDASPDAARQRPREVTPVQVAAMIYYNRGVDLLANQRFADALHANAKALRLDPRSETARGNLLATLNNWAITLGTQGRYAEAAARLEQGMRIDPAYDTLVGNYTHVHFQWVEHLCQSGRYSEAIDVLQHGGQVRPERAYFREARLEVFLRWARAELAADRFDDAGRVFRVAAEHLGATPALLNAEISLVRDRATALAGGPQPQRALELLQQSLQRYPDAELLHESYRQWAGERDAGPQASGAAHMEPSAQTAPFLRQSPPPPGSLVH